MRRVVETHTRHFQETGDFDDDGTQDTRNRTETYQTVRYEFVDEPDREPRIEVERIVREETLFGDGDVETRYWEEGGEGLPGFDEADNPLDVEGYMDRLSAESDVADSTVLPEALPAESDTLRLFEAMGNIEGLLDDYDLINRPFTEVQSMAADWDPRWADTTPYDLQNPTTLNAFIADARRSERQPGYGATHMISTTVDGGVATYTLAGQPMTDEQLVQVLDFIGYPLPSDPAAIPAELTRIRQDDGYLVMQGQPSLEDAYETAVMQAAHGGRVPAGTPDFIARAIDGWNLYDAGLPSGLPPGQAPTNPAIDNLPATIDGFYDTYGDVENIQAADALADARTTLTSVFGDDLPEDALAQFAPYAHLVDVEQARTFRDNPYAYLKTLEMTAQIGSISPDIMDPQPGALITISDTVRATYPDVFPPDDQNISFAELVRLIEDGVVDPSVVIGSMADEFQGVADRSIYDYGHWLPAAIIEVGGGDDSLNMARSFAGDMAGLFNGNLAALEGADPAMQAELLLSSMYQYQAAQEAMPFYADLVAQEGAAFMNAYYNNLETAGNITKEIGSYVFAAYALGAGIPPAQSTAAFRAGVGIILDASLQYGRDGQLDAAELLQTGFADAIAGAFIGLPVGMSQRATTWAAERMASLGANPRTAQLAGQLFAGVFSSHSITTGNMLSSWVLDPSLIPTNSEEWEDIMVTMTASAASGLLVQGPVGTLVGSRNPFLAGRIREVEQEVLQNLFVATAENMSGGQDFLDAAWSAITEEDYATTVALTLAIDLGTGGIGDADPMRQFTTKDDGIDYVRARLEDAGLDPDEVLSDPNVAADIDAILDSHLGLDPNPTVDELLPNAPATVVAAVETNPHLMELAVAVGPEVAQAMFTNEALVLNLAVDPALTAEVGAALAGVDPTAAAAFMGDPAIQPALAEFSTRWPAAFRRVVANGPALMASNPDASAVDAFVAADSMNNPNYQLYATVDGVLTPLGHHSFVTSGTLTQLTGDVEFLHYQADGDISPSDADLGFASIANGLVDGGASHAIVSFDGDRLTRSADFGALAPAADPAVLDAARNDPSFIMPVSGNVLHDPIIVQGLGLFFPIVRTGNSPGTHVLGFRGLRSQPDNPITMDTVEGFFTDGVHPSRVRSGEANAGDIESLPHFQQFWQSVQDSTNNSAGSVVMLTRNENLAFDWAAGSPVAADGNVNWATFTGNVMRSMANWPNNITRPAYLDADGFAERRADIDAAGGEVIFIRDADGDQRQVTMDEARTILGDDAFNVVLELAAPVDQHIGIASPVFLSPSHQEEPIVGSVPPEGVLSVTIIWDGDLP